MGLHLLELLRFQVLKEVLGDATCDSNLLLSDLNIALDSSSEPPAVVLLFQPSPACFQSLVLHKVRFPLSFVHRKGLLAFKLFLFLNALNSGEFQTLADENLKDG